MRTRLFLAAMLVTAILSPNCVDAQTSQGSDDPLRHGHALLIGNSNYRAWPQLVDVPLQLDELARGLESHFDTVEVVKDLEIDALRQKINGFLRSYGNDSNARLFIYFAGHGYTEEIQAFNENRGYITGIDTPTIDGSTRGYNAARPKAMSMLEIRSPLAEVLAKHILFVFDSCFAGTIFTSRAGNEGTREWKPDVVKRLMEKPARDIITAGDANQRVPAHSPIPRLLVAALNGEADRYGHGVISAADIKSYLWDQMLHLPGVNLTPQQGRLQDPNFAEGEFLFRVPRRGQGGPAVDAAAQAWITVQNTASVAALDAFIRRYGDTFYADLARLRIEELKGIQTAVVVPPVRQGASPGCGGSNATVSLALRSAVPLSAIEECALKPKDSFKECNNCPEMVVVPAGKFMMGSNDEREEMPVHGVSISQPFAAGKFEVTFAEWDACVADRGCNTRPDDMGWGRGRRPVINVSFEEIANEYLPWLSAKTGKQYRLLTEAEWEYAARGGTATAYFWGNEVGHNRANCDGCGSQWDNMQTAPVGSFQANAFGLHDMHGNVREWVEDNYAVSHVGAPSDGAARRGSFLNWHVVRGGSWDNIPWYMRSAARTYITLERFKIVGFRAARNLSQ
jgi:formylglycine-generating enzyme required for sulfatase activity